MASRNRSKSQKARSTGRKRKSGPTLSVSGFLWILAIVSLGSGLGFSQATGLRSVKVVGGTADQVQGIEKRLQPWAKIPWVRQNRFAMETAVLADNRLASAEVVSNIFGRGDVTVVARTPVGRIVPDVKEGEVPISGIYLDETGFLYRDGWSESFSGVGIQVPSGVRELHLGVAPVWSTSSLAEICGKSRDLWSEAGLTVVLDERSVLSLVMADGPRIILGTEIYLDQKFLVLERAFRDENAKMMRTKLINVSAPDRPVFTD